MRTNQVGLLCPSLFSAHRILAQPSYTNQTNIFPTPPTHQRQARISGCSKRNKIKPQATQGKQYLKLDPVSGTWLLQPAATFNLYPPLTYASNHQSTPKPTSTSPNRGPQPSFQKQCFFFSTRLKNFAGQRHSARVLQHK